MPTNGWANPKIIYQTTITAPLKFCPASPMIKDLSPLAAIFATHVQINVYGF